MTLLEEPPEVSIVTADDDHLAGLRVDPIEPMNRVRTECGDVGKFRIAGRSVILLSGAEATEFFFRSSDDELDQGKAYPFMQPIFGAGVVFDDGVAVDRIEKGVTIRTMCGR